MSSQTPAQPEQKKLRLTDLLAQVNQMLSEPGTKSGEEGYHAPSVTILHIVRIALTRTIEHVVDFKKSFGAIFGAITDPALKKNEPWRSDIPKLRKRVAELEEQQKETTGLLSELVARVNPGAAAAAAQGQAPVPPVPPASAPPAGNGSTKVEEEPIVPPSEIDKLAADLAAGGTPDLSRLHREGPPAPVVPIRPAQPDTQSGNS